MTGIFALTDSRGFYEIPGLSGRVDLRASKDGYEGQSRVAQMAAAFTVSNTASFRAYLKWTNTFDLDLELWRDDALVAASLTCQSCGVGTAEESFTRTITPGDYELRVTWYYFFDRDEITPYELTVTPAN